ncbi:MAG: DUF1801 domain-containing protein, partial [Vicinamibacterales bacterium]
MTKKSLVSTTDASRLIDARIAQLTDWRGELLARIRKIIKQADPDAVEEWKWRGVPAWSHAGILCTGETYKSVVKMTFAKGAALDDPAGLFNSSLEGNTRRAIDLREGDRVNERALKALIREAVRLNASKPATKSAKVKAGAKPKLLSGGNPQIAKADGDGIVQAYIAAMPGWKSGVGRHLDELVTRTLPDVRKAVKWNSPFYGMAGRGWFLSFHTFTHYVKVTFFNGASLRPLPPGASKQQQTRY